MVSMQATVSWPLLFINSLNLRLSLKGIRTTRHLLLQMNTVTEGRNPRGIPAAKFIDNIEHFLDTTNVETALGAYNELYSKYKFMESSFEKSKNAYKSKIPEIERTLELIDILRKRSESGEEILTNYSLCDTIYSKAKVDTSSKVVGLWIGANTMVEYTYDEATELLTTQLTQSHLKIAELGEDLSFLRAQSITVEVNMARLFNHSVKLKKLLEAKQAT